MLAPRRPQDSRANCQALSTSLSGPFAEESDEDSDKETRKQIIASIFFNVGKRPLLSDDDLLLLRKSHTAYCGCYVSEIYNNLLV